MKNERLKKTKKWGSLKRECQESRPIPRLATWLALASGHSPTPSTLHGGENPLEKFASWYELFHLLVTSFWPCFMSLWRGEMTWQVNRTRKLVGAARNGTETRRWRREKLNRLTYFLYSWQEDGESSNPKGDVVASLRQKARKGRGKRGRW